MRLTTLSSAAVLLSFYFASCLCSAAAINWGSPFEIVTDADLSLSYGPILYAISGGDHDGPIEELSPDTQAYPAPPANIVVGAKTVPLQWTQVNTGPDSLFVSPTFGEVLDYLPGDNLSVSLSTETERAPEVLGDFDDALFTGLTVRSDFDGGTTTLLASNRIYQPHVIEPGNSLTGNAALDSVLNSSVWADGRIVGFSTLIVDLNQLTAGKEYQVQIIANADSRPPGGATIERNLSAITVDDGNGGVSGELGVFRDLDGDGFRHVNSVLGTFTADDAVQRLNLILANGRNPGFSLLLVSEKSAALTGDFNGDGSVDAADYTVWRDNLGADDETAIGNNGDGMNGVDPADYLVWKSYFGTTAGPTGGGSALGEVPVPEPAASVLVILAAMAGLMRFSRTR